MTTRVLAESTVSDPETLGGRGHPDPARARVKLPVPVLLHGEEDGAWPVLEYALRMKQDTRIGFEDVLVRPDGWLATGNDDLVASALDPIERAGPVVQASRRLRHRILAFATESARRAWCQAWQSVGPLKYRQMYGAVAGDR